MRYSCEIEIGRPRDHVIALFDDAENLPKWQDGLLKFDHVSGEYGKPGSKYDLAYQMGKRRVDMVETIVDRRIPEYFSAIYEAKGVWNFIENHFTDTPHGGTHWRVETEFRCGWFLRLLGWIMPGMFRKQTKKMMVAFKQFAEGTEN